MNWKTHFIDGLKFLAIFVLGVICLSYLTNWWSSYTDHVESSKEQRIHQIIGQPYIHKGDKVANNVAKQGELIFVHNKYIRTDRCEMRVANLLINPLTNDVHHWSTFANWLNAGTFTADEMYKIPDWMPPATYRLVKRTTAVCSDRTVFFVNFDLIVEIRAAGSPAPQDR
jgi:hypothetical protein